MSCTCLTHRPRLSRRHALLAAAGLFATAPGVARAGIGREARDRMTADQVLETMRAGNARFLAGQTARADMLARQRETAAGQYPATVILSCIDSRAPAELIFDLDIGDAFNTRTAGPVVNADVLGGMEFACRLAGAKVVLVMGHTACGAVRGAVADAKLGNLTGLLARIRPAVEQTPGGGGPDDAAFVDRVAARHVALSLERIRAESPVLREMETERSVRLAGAMYDLATGAVTFL